MWLLPVLSCTKSWKLPLGIGQGVAVKVFFVKASPPCALQCMCCHTVLDGVAAAVVFGFDAQNIHSPLERVFPVLMVTLK
jgi:hypothetical protein